MAFKRGTRVVSRSTRRLTSWFQFVPADTTLGGASVALVFSLNAAALALRPFTVVRSHFVVKVRSDQAAAIEQQNVGFGIAVVSDQAVAIGVTAVPTPITEMGSNLWFQHALIFSDESALTDRTRPAVGKDLDSKAMRKVEIGQDIIVVLETSPSIGNGAIVTVGGRMLIKNN